MKKGTEVGEKHCKRAKRQALNGTLRDLTM